MWDRTQDFLRRLLRPAVVRASLAAFVREQPPNQALQVQALQVQALQVQALQVRMQEEIPEEARQREA